MKIYLVITAYNEEKTITRVIKAARKYIKDIIVVDDHSTDNTLSFLRKLPVSLVKNDHNLGYAKSLEQGLIYAFQNKKADFAITFDADGQHQAPDIQKFISIIKKGKYDLIVGLRKDKNRFMEYVMGIYSKIKYGFSDPLCGFKAYKRDLFQKYGFLENIYSIASELTLCAIRDGIKFKEVKINTKKRKDQARFGNTITGNWRELKAFINIIFMKNVFP